MRFGLLFLVGGCSLVEIPVRGESTTTVSRGTLLESLVGDLGFGDFLDMDVMASEELANQDVQPGDVREVRLNELELEAVAGGDLSFLESVAVSVEAPDLAATRVAFVDGFEAGQTLAPFTIDDVDLAPYVVSERMSLTTEVTGHRPEDDTDVTARFELGVRVTGQGVFRKR